MAQSEKGLLDAQTCMIALRKESTWRVPTLFMAIVGEGKIREITMIASFHPRNTR